MLTLPNILTLSRILAVPLLAFLLWWAMALKRDKRQAIPLGT